MRGAFVISRNSAFSYKGRGIDVRQVGRELNVRYVLEGSVQRSDKRLRVNVQLVDAESGNRLWAERFDKPVADLFDMQDEIVSTLARALGYQFVVAEARPSMMFALMDADGDGTISLQEFQAAHERIFKAMDSNKDGKLTLEEMQAFIHGTR